MTAALTINRRGGETMKPRHIYTPLIVGILTPSAVVLALDILSQRRVPGPPSGTTLSGDIFFTALALIPFAGLILAAKIVSAKLTGWRLECVFWGGLLAIT